jgi:hypothetical protein
VTYVNISERFVRKLRIAVPRSIHLVRAKRSCHHDLDLALEQLDRAEALYPCDKLELTFRASLLVALGRLSEASTVLTDADSTALRSKRDGAYVDAYISYLRALIDGDERLETKLYRQLQLTGSSRLARRWLPSP